MNKLKELVDPKPPVGSYEAMKPWFDKIDKLCDEFEAALLCHEKYIK